MDMTKKFPHPFSPEERHNYIKIKKAIKLQQFGKRTTNIKNKNINGITQWNVYFNIKVHCMLNWMEKKLTERVEEILFQY